MINVPQGKYELIKDRFGPTPAELEKIDVWNPLVGGKITSRNELPRYKNTRDGVATRLVFQKHPSNQFEAYKSTVGGGGGVTWVSTDLVPTALRRSRS